MTTTNYLIDLLHPELVSFELYIRGGGSTWTGSSSKKLDEPSFAWQSMAEDWRVIRDLLGGTRGMRLARERYLPKFAKETPQEYQARLDTSFLVDMLDDTIDVMVSKPFSKAVSFKGDVPDWVLELNEDVDGRGTTIHEFAKNLFQDGWRWGKSHLGVDARNMPTELPDAPQVKDFEGALPRFRIIPGPNLLNWRQAGRNVYEVRFYEREVDGNQVIERLNIWDESTMAVSERTDSQKDFRKPTVTASHRIGQLPIEVFYTKRTAEYCATPPLMDLAWVSVDHWQSYSDQRQILHTARIPILYENGVTEADIKRGTTTIGSKRKYTRTGTDADMKYVEIGGQSMQEGREHLKMLAEAAREKGAQPLHSLGPVTATGEVRADSKASCDLQASCEALERVLLRGYRMAQKAVPGLQELPEDFRPVIFTEFDLRDRSAEDMSQLSAARSRGDISRRTWWSEGQRRSLLPEDFDPEAEEALLDKEKAEGDDPMADDPLPTARGRAGAMNGRAK